MSDEKTVAVELTETELEVLIDAAFSIGFDDLSEKFEEALAQLRGAK